MLPTDLGTCEWFVGDLRRSHLLNPERLDILVGDYLTRHPQAEPAALAENLVARGALTAIQAEHLLKGKGAANPAQTPVEALPAPESPAPGSNGKPPPTAGVPTVLAPHWREATAGSLWPAAESVNGEKRPAGALGTALVVLVGAVLLCVALGVAAVWLVLSWLPS